jgi:hypothetical protein
MDSNKAAIETAATGSTPTPQANPATPPAETINLSSQAPSTPPNEQAKYEDGGKTEDGKIQWVAIGIFTLTIVSLVYKAMYYRKAMTLIGSSGEKTDKKMQELEKNIRAVRRDKYESIS